MIYFIVVDRLLATAVSNNQVRTRSLRSDTPPIGANIGEAISKGVIDKLDYTYVSSGITSVYD